MKDIVKIQTLRERISREMYSLTDDSVLQERIRICLGCMYFSLMLKKCSSCGCDPRRWQGRDKLLNKDYHCPKDYWR